MWIDFHLHDGGLTITTALTVLSDNFFVKIDALLQEKLTKN